MPAKRLARGSNRTLWNYPEVTLYDFVDRLAYKRGNTLDDLESICRDDDHGQMPSGKVMVLGNTRIRRYEDIEPFALGGTEQLAVFQRTPRHVHDGSDIVSCQDMAKLDRETLVDQDAPLTPQT